MLITYLVLGMLFTTISIRKSPDSFKTIEIILITALWLPIVLILLTTKE